MYSFITCLLRIYLLLFIRTLNSTTLHELQENGFTNVNFQLKSTLTLKYPSLSLIHSNKTRLLTVPPSFNTSLECSFFYITCIKYCYLSSIGGRMNRRIRVFYMGIIAKNAKKNSKQAYRFNFPFRYPLLNSHKKSI